MFLQDQSDNQHNVTTNSVIQLDIICKISDIFSKVCIPFPDVSQSND